MRCSKSSLLEGKGWPDTLGLPSTLSIELHSRRWPFLSSQTSSSTNEHSYMTQNNSECRQLLKMPFSNAATEDVLSWGGHEDDVQ